MALGGVGGWLALLVKRVLVLYFLQVYHIRGIRLYQVHFITKEYHTSLPYESTLNQQLIP